MKIRLQHRDGSGVLQDTLELSKVKTLRTFAYFTEFADRAGMVLSYHEKDFNATRLAALESGFVSVEQSATSGWEEPRNATYFFDSGFTDKNGVRTALFLGLEQALVESGADVTSLEATMDDRGRLESTADAREVIESLVADSMDAVFTVTSDASTWTAGTYTPPLVLSDCGSVAAVIRAYERFGRLRHYWQGFELHLTLQDVGGITTGVEADDFKVSLKASVGSLVPLSVARLSSTDVVNGVRFSYLDSTNTPQSYLLSGAGTRPFTKTVSATAPLSVTDLAGVEAFADWFFPAGMAGSSHSVLLRASVGSNPNLLGFRVGDLYSLEGETLELSYLSVYLTPAGFEAKLVFGGYSPAVEAQLELL